MNSIPSLTQPAVYRIRVAGRVRDGWSDYIHGLSETHPREGGATLTELQGTLPDQAALFGLLCHIRDLGLPLVAVEFIENVSFE